MYIPFIFKKIYLYIFKSFTLRLILTISLSILIFLLSSNFSLKDENIISFFAGALNLLNLDNLSDSYIKNVISKSISTFTILVSLLSAIYVFTFREQKSISPSGSIYNSKNNLLFRLINLIVFNIIFSVLILTYYSGHLKLDNSYSNLDITKEMFFSILILIFTFICLIRMLIKFISYLFKTMSLNNMLKDSIHATEKQLNLLINLNYKLELQEKNIALLINKKEDILNSNKYTYKEYFRIKKLDNLILRKKKFIKDPIVQRSILNEYSKLHFTVESVYQNLKFISENNMNKEFLDNIMLLQEVFSKLEKSPSTDSNMQSTHMLMQQFPVEFTEFYNSILRNNISLIAFLLKNNQNDKAKALMNLHFNLYYDNIDLLIQVFSINLNDLLDIIDIKDATQVSIFLNSLKLLPEGRRLLHYKYLLMKLIHNDQLMIITNIIYDLEIENYIYKPSLCLIIVQNLIKSLEVSNYKISGFLVKFLINNYTGKHINKALSRVNNKPNSFTSSIESLEDIEDIMEQSRIDLADDTYSLKINIRTFHYCLSKAYVLLHAQHVFSIENKLWHTSANNETTEDIDINLHFDDIQYSNYILTKIYDVSEYGLKSLESDTVKKLTYEKLKVDL